jgi:hypothetical protein
LLPSEAKREHFRSLAGADALVDELVAPFLAETRPMRLRRERAEARAAFLARVQARADELVAAGGVREPSYHPRESAAERTPPLPAPIPGPAQDRADSATVSPSPAPALPETSRAEHDAATLRAAIALGLIDDDEGEP